MPEFPFVTRPSSGRGRRTARLRLAATALRSWTWREVTTAVVGAILVTALIGYATVLIPNEVFSRDIPPVWWDYPVWILTGAICGALIATYVGKGPQSSSSEGSQSQDDGAAQQSEDDGAAQQSQDDGAAQQSQDRNEQRSGRLGMTGAVLGWFAVGCPVCNKIALLALGYTGALTWFAPFQPVLAVAALVLTSVALVWRLSGQVACPVPRRARAGQGVLQ